MTKTYVTAVITAREGCAAALETELRKVVAPVRAEPGCLRYDLHRAGGAFLFYEMWASPAHLEAHGRTPHMAAMRAATADLTARPAEVALWESVDTAG